jgi:hypothetical protein
MFLNRWTLTLTICTCAIFVEGVDSEKYISAFYIKNKKKYMCFKLKECKCYSYSQYEVVVLNLW